MNNEFSQWANAVIFLIPNWKWVGLLIGLLAGLLLHSILKNFFKNLKNSNWARIRATGFLLHFMETNLQGPGAWVLTSIFWTATIDSLSLPASLDKYLKIATQLILSLNLIILAYRAAEAFGQLLNQYSSRTEHKLDNQLTLMATKVLKVLVVIFGILITLQNFNVQVLSILAGLGLGGLALALAAQDTVANLFGSIMIIVDRPFRIGDYIKVGSTEGAVEEIGFRSTRIRTPYNSLITIPNSVVAKETIDNLALRPQRRIKHVLGLEYGTSEDKIKFLIQDIESYLTAQSKVDKAQITVRLQALGDFSLQILVQFFVLTQDWNEEMAVQQDFLFHVMKSAEQKGIGFAFPTSTQIVKLMDYQAVALMGANKTAPGAPQN